MSEVKQKKELYKSVRGLKELKIKGTQVAYSIICKRKLWLFSKGVAFEYTSDRVRLGKLIDETSFRNEEELRDDSVSIDFIRSGDEIAVHKIKLSSYFEEAHILQVKYYIYYLRNKGMNVSKGILHYPKAKKIEEVEFIEEDKTIIDKALDIIEKTLKYGLPPKVEKKPYCLRCAYYEFCYGQSLLHTFRWEIVKKGEYSLL